MDEINYTSTQVRLWDITIEKIDSFTIPNGPANQSRQQKADWIVDRLLDELQECPKC